MNTSPRKHSHTLAVSLLLTLPAALVPFGVTCHFTSPAAASADSGGIKTAAIPAVTTAPKQVNQARAAEAYGKSPMSFEVNRGQTDARAKFLARGSGYSLFLTSSGAVLSLNKPATQGSSTESFTARRGGRVGAGVRGRARPDVLRMKVLGGNPAARVSGLEELPGKSNYLLGNDPKRWRTNVACYAQVKYEAVYRGVDMVYYGNQRELEYDFIVAPGASPAAIRLAFEGAQTVKIDERGDLVLRTKGGEVRQRKPFLYQEAGGERREVAGRYVKRGNRQVGFEVAEYDTTKPLVIDPVLVYSTYLGGNSDDQGEGIAVDADGNAYVAGFAQSTNFPTFPDSPTERPFQPGHGGGLDDAFVTKFNAAGAVVYSTYLGGSGSGEQFSGSDDATGIAVDADGNAYVVGGTNSLDFPTKNPIKASGDSFLTKLNAAGSGLVYSTYLNDGGEAVAIDGLGSAYVTGTAFTSDFTRFTIVTKVNASGTEIVSSMQVGEGTRNFGGSSIAVHTQGSAYVVRQVDGYGRFELGGGISVTKLTYNGQSGGASIAYSKSFGGHEPQSGNPIEGIQSTASDIAADALGNVYITGFTNTRDFPVQGAVQPTNRGVGGGVYDAIVMKLNAEGGVVYSTYLGGSGNDSGGGIAFDGQGNAYITGETDSTDFPTQSPLQAARAGDAEEPESDAFVTKLNAVGSGLLYSTYFGGSDSDYGNDIAVDTQGRAYVTGFTNSTDFPTQNPFQGGFGGAGDESYDAFVIKIADAPPGFSIGVVDLDPAMEPSLPRKPSTQTILLQVKDGQGNPVTDADLRVEREAVTLVEGTDTDGHSHSNESRPPGTFRRDAGPASPDGIYKFTYTAPEVAGLIKARALCTGCAEKPFEIKVKLDGLEALPESSSNRYKLIGNDGINQIHPKNHFGTPDLNRALIALADSYFNEYKLARPLEYNDMSLRFGGLFDVGETRWQPSHYEHRIGLNVDLRVQAQEAVPPGNRLKLRQFAHAQNLGILIHPKNKPRPHWHLTFGHVKCIIAGGAPCTDGSVIKSVAGKGITRAAGAHTSAAGLTLYVTPAVSFDPATNLYTYTYSLRNDAASALEASSILIATSGSEVTNVRAPQGWTAALIEGRVAVEFAATEVGQLPADYVDDGNLVPSPFQIKPGQALDGFSFQSPDPPASVDFYAQGFKPIPTVDDETDVEGPASDLDDSFKGSTTGPKASSLQLGQIAYTINEGAGRATVTVTRAGNTTAAATVEYQTTDADTFTVGCADAAGAQGAAFARCDFATSVGTINFAASETEKSVTVPVVDDAHVEENETFQLRLSNPAGATLGAFNLTTITIVDNDAAGALNPVLGPPHEFFVRQQYLDFLSREPDAAGFNAWLGVLNGCLPNANTGPEAQSGCDRIFVSGEGFFRSVEFQLKGAYAFRFYKAAFNRLPEYPEIVSDMSFVAGTTAEEVFARRAQLAERFTNRQEFVNAFGGLTNAQFVNTLMDRYGLQSITTPDPAAPDGAARVTLTRQNLIDRLGLPAANPASLTRAQALRAVADSDEVGAREFNNAFVAMQYYGYLRRKPEPAGYEAWLRVLGSGDTRTMVNGFLNSAEYRLRFGRP